MSILIVLSSVPKRCFDIYMIISLIIGFNVGCDMYQTEQKKLLPLSLAIGSFIVGIIATLGWPLWIVRKIWVRIKKSAQ